MSQVRQSLTLGHLFKSCAAVTMIRECAEWDGADLYQMRMFFPRGFCSDISSSDNWFKRNFRNGQAPNP